MFLDSHKPRLDHIPQRIISTVPSLTELLFDLGCNKEVIGITKFCIHPPDWKSSKKIIGGTKNLRIQDINLLSPDLIIANKEENTKEEIELLSINHNILLTDIKNISDAKQVILLIGTILNRKEQAIQLMNTIDIRTRRLQEVKDQYKPNLRVCYLIWKDPFMTIGHDTFIHSMLTECGFINVFEDLERYPQVSMEKILERKADYIFLSSEPYPFKGNHIQEFYASKATLVDGEAFSWYGSHIVKSFSYFCNLIPQLA